MDVDYVLDLVKMIIVSFISSHALSHRKFLQFNKEVAGSEYADSWTTVKYADGWAEYQLNLKLQKRGKFLFELFNDEPAFEDNLFSIGYKSST